MRWVLLFWLYLILPISGVVVSWDILGESIVLGDVRTMNLTMNFDKSPENIRVLPISETLSESLFVREQGPLQVLDETTVLWPIQVQFLEVGDVLIPTISLQMDIDGRQVVAGVPSGYFSVGSVRSVSENSEFLMLPMRKFLKIPLMWYWRYAWIFLLVGLVVVVVVILFRNRRKKPEPELQEPTPFERVMAVLEQLESVPVLEHKQSVLFCFQLTEAIKAYYGSLYKVSLLETTTTECLLVLTPFLDSECRRFFQIFLNQCDDVKFAKVSLTSDSKRILMDKARALVNRR